MNKNQQSGFILMIVILVVILLAAVWFAFYRIQNASDENSGVNSSQQLG